MSNPLGSYQVGAGGVAPPTLKVPALTFDVSKYGADPTVTGSINTALANILADPTWPANSQGATIYVPDTYPIAEPLFFPDTNFVLEGGGPGCGLSGGNSHVAIIGLKKEFGSMPLTTGHWPAMVGMDAGYASGRYGFAIYDPATGLTNPDMRYLTFFGSPFGIGGNHWTTVNKFTIEFAVNSQIAGAAPGAASLGPGIPPPGFGFGFAPIDTQPTRPWIFQMEGANFTTTSATGGATPTMAVVLGLGFNTFFGVGGGLVPNAFLVITGGTGIGQIKQITAFSGNGVTENLTFGSAWTTVPDATSTGYITSDIFFNLTLATTKLDDGTSPGYDPYTFGSPTNTGFAFPANLPVPTNGVWRFKLQFDLTATTPANFIQGWVSTTGSAAANFVAMVPGVTPPLPLVNPYLVSCDFNLFQVGSVYHSAINDGTNPFGPGGTPKSAWDLTIYGLSITAGVAGGNVYSIGATPVINPSGPSPTGTIGDTYSYYPRGNNNAIALLPMTDSGGGFNSGRLFACMDGGGYVSSGFVFPFFGGGGSQVGGGCTVKNMTLSGARYGACVLIGGALSCTVEDVKLVGGAHGIGILPVFANYTHVFSNINCIYCNDAAIYLYRSAAIIRNFGTSVCWASLRLVTSTIEADNVTFGNVENTPYQVRMHAGGYGSAMLIKYISCDNESLGSGPTSAIIYADNESQGATCEILIDFLATGTTNYGVPYIRLQSIGNQAATFIMRNAAINGAHTPLVRVCGGNIAWKGTISDPLLGAGGNAPDFDFDLFPIIDATFGAKTSRIAYKPSLPSFPFTGVWNAGATTVEILAEGLVPGMPKRYTVVATGQFGTVNPPVFDGYDVYSPDGTHNALFGLAPREDYGSATISRV